MMQTRFSVVNLITANLAIQNTKKRESVQMNNEYLQAKFDLCINQAEKELQEKDIAHAIANLRRANSALSQLFGFEEENNE